MKAWNKSGVDIMNFWIRFPQISIEISVEANIF
jgi:hypothetical protein